MPEEQKKQSAGEVYDAPKTRRDIPFEDENQFNKMFDADLVRKAFAFAAPYKKTFMGALSMLICLAAANLLTPWITKLIIDEGITYGSITLLGHTFGSGTAHDRFTIVTAVCAAFLLIWIVRWIINYWYSVVLTSLAQRVINDIRLTLFSHIQRMSLSKARRSAGLFGGGYCHLYARKYKQNREHHNEHPFHNISLLCVPLVSILVLYCLSKADSNKIICIF